MQSLFYTGRDLETLQTWAASQWGERLYYVLIHDFRQTCGLAELALIFIALQALLRLRPVHFERPHPSRLDIFDQFLQFLTGHVSCGTRATLEYMGWPFHAIVEDREISRLLEATLPLDQAYSTRGKAYFTYRESCSNDQALRRMKIEYSLRFI